MGCKKYGSPPSFLDQFATFYSQNIRVIPQIFEYFHYLNGSQPPRNSIRKSTLSCAHVSHLLGGCSPSRGSSPGRRRSRRSSSSTGRRDDGDDGHSIIIITIRHFSLDVPPHFRCLPSPTSPLLLYGGRRLER